ncbi:type II toxin-antitoxin system HicB family antitoxin [Sinomicrobium sp.]
MATYIKVFVEKADDGTYWGTTQDIPGVVSTFGNSLQELKQNLKIAFDDYIEVAESENEDWVAEVKKRKGFVYHMDMKSFFKLVPEVKITAIAEKAHINASLMRQYVTGRANASEYRVRQIEKAIHELGEELLSVSF